MTEPSKKKIGFLISLCLFLFLNFPLACQKYEPVQIPSYQDEKTIITDFRVDRDKIDINSLPHAPLKLSLRLNENGDLHFKIFKSANNSLVRAVEVPNQKGDVEVKWDGTGDDGTQVDPGRYWIGAILAQEGEVKGRMAVVFIDLIGE